MYLQYKHHLDVDLRVHRKNLMSMIVASMYSVVKAQYIGVDPRPED